MYRNKKNVCNQAVKQIEPINLLYRTKKSIVIYERVFGQTPYINNAQIEIIRDSIKTQDDFENLCINIINSLNKIIKSAKLTDSDKAFLAEHRASDFLDLAETSDFNIISYKHHCRKFFNEIENDVIVETLINSFLKVWNLPNDGPYFIEIYAVNDSPVYFPSYDALCDFVKRYDACPYSVFEVKDNIVVELFSA